MLHEYIIQLKWTNEAAARNWSISTPFWIFLFLGNKPIQLLRNTFLEVWEPPTKQFYPKCQSPRFLPCSQSAWSIAAPSCIGSQSIRDGHPERQSQWLQCNERVRTYLRTCIKKLRALVSWLPERSRRVTATKTNRPAHRPVETALALHSVQYSGSPFKVNHEHSVQRACSHRSILKTTT
jgi:hypothetical protein